MKPIVLGLVLAGCTTPEVPIAPPIGEFILDDAYDVQGFEANAAGGNLPLTTVVRAVNRWGAAVGSEPVGITVGGSAVTVPFDSLGYGSVRIESEGLVLIDDGTDVVEAVGLASDWPGFGMSRAFPSPAPGATAADGITTGSIVAIGRELFYVGPDAPPHRVLNADNAIRGIQAGHINVDGVEDLVAWTETTVYLMRGRLKGGLAFGAAITAAQYRVGGASIGELTNDNLPDLVIAWSSQDGSSKLDEWHGNGLFGFKAAEPRNLPSIPISVSIGDSTGEGTNQITVLSEDGTWARFIAGSDVRYMPIGPSTPSEVSIPLGSTVQATGDVNGDGGEEMWFLGPLNADTVRKIVVVDLVGQKIEFLPLNPMAAHVDRADLDGDLLVDHIELHGTQALRALSYDVTAGNYAPRALVDLPAYGPLSVEDNLDQDGIPDLFVAADDFWWWWRGHNDPLSSDVYWQIGEQAMAEAAAAIGPIVAAELDGDGNTQEILGFTDNNGTTVFTVWSWNRTTQASSVLGSVVASAGGVEPLDLALCGNRAYAALEGQVVRFDLANPASPSVGQSINSSGTRIDCGAAPSGGVAAVLDGGTIDVLDVSLNVLTTLTAGAAQDIAIGDAGAGPEVAHCTQAGCSIVFWDFGTGGAFATGSDNQISVDGAAVATLDGHGMLTVADVDSNGVQDLIAAGADGMVTVYRSTGSDIAPAEVFHSVNLPGTAAAIGDSDGDGHPDLWLRDVTDRLLVSRAPITRGQGGGTTP